MAHERILYIKRHAGFLAGVLVILAMTGIVVTTNRFWQIPSKEVMNMGLPQGFELAMDETDDALWHFIHTSDLHLQFDSSSGDLGDSTHNTANEGEFIAYREAVMDAGLYNRTDFYLDMRGNHDAIGVLSWESEENYFRTYSVSAAAGLLDDPPHALLEAHHTHPITGSVKWTLFDSTGFPGLDMRWNLLISGWNPEVKKLVTDSLLSASALPNLQHVFAVGHYPSQQWGTHRGDLETLADTTSFTAYLCGHVHQDNWWLYRPGWAELEVGDFKHRNRYRIYALDNSVIAHVDATQGEWPVVLVTNPKNAQFLLEREPLGAIAASTHIRVLGWSPDGIASGQVKLAGRKYCDLEQTGAKGELWTCPWEPSEFSAGVHKLEVTMTDGAGRKAVSKQLFSTDGTHGGLPLTIVDIFAEMNFGDWASLMTVLMWLYVIAWKLICPALFARWLEKTGQTKVWNRGVRSRLAAEMRGNYDGQDALPELIPGYITHIVPVKQFWAVQQLPSWMWWWYVGQGFYMIFGPHHIGDLTHGEGRIHGIVWAWGVTVFGHGTYRRFEPWPFNLEILMWSTYPSLVIATMSMFSAWPGVASLQSRRAYAAVIALSGNYLAHFAVTRFWGFKIAFTTILPGGAILGNAAIVAYTYWHNRRSSDVVTESGGDEAPSGTDEEDQELIEKKRPMNAE